MNAALLMAAAGVVGFVYHQTTVHDDFDTCHPSVTRQCGPNVAPKASDPPPCAEDDPCVPDTLLEQRWRMAHQQGLQHALLLFCFAIGAPYFRVGRFLFSFVGWLILIGAWGAPTGATIQALTLFSPDPGWIQLHRGIGIVAGLTTSLALLIVAIRSVWEVARVGIAPSTWKNWARIVYARPRRIVEPDDLPELLEMVQAAMDRRMCIRAFGGRYSWSAIAPTDGTMVDMRHLREIDDPVPSQGPQPATVRVEAGATLRELAESLAKHGLMLETSTVNPWVQVGGALALGCHGTGVRHRPLSDLVTKIEIVQYVYVNGRPTAKLEPYSRPPQPLDGSDAWRKWNALLVNLGCLGVMYRITFECVPIYDVHIVDTVVPMEATLQSDATLRALLDPVNGKEYLEIFWFPFNKDCFVRTWERIPAGTAPGFGRWFWIKQWLTATLFGPVALNLLAIVPFLTRVLSGFMHRFVGSLDHEVPAPDAMQYQRWVMRVYDMGYAIPYSADPASPIGFTLLRKAWFSVVDRLVAFHMQGIYPQNLVLHARFGAKTTALLAPSTGNDFSCYLEIVTHANTARHEEHFAAVERDWLRFGGRSHWGKVSYNLHRIRDSYPPANVDDFLDVRRRMDPEQFFLNDYLREVLRVEEP